MLQTDNHTNTRPLWPLIMILPRTSTHLNPAMHTCTRASLVRRLSAWHCSRSLLIAVLLGAGRAATDRYLLPAGPTAANPPHALKRSTAGTDCTTDGQTHCRYVDPAAHIMQPVSTGCCPDTAKHHAAASSNFPTDFQQTKIRRGRIWLSAPAWGSITAGLGCLSTALYRALGADTVGDYFSAKTSLLNQTSV